MPTYQYACKESACGHRFEAVQAFSDDPVATCPVCEGQVRKVFSAVGVVFKGSGFYRNDSRETVSSSGKNGAAKESGSDAGSGSGSGEKKSEASSTSSSSTSSDGGSGSSGAKSSSPSGSTSAAAAS